jgi:hypothetical protein
MITDVETSTTAPVFDRIVEQYVAALTGGSGRARRRAAARFTRLFGGIEQWRRPPSRRPSG